MIKCFNTMEEELIKPSPTTHNESHKITIDIYKIFPTLEFQNILILHKTPAHHHWNRNVLILTLSSLAALTRVISTTFSVSKDENVVKIKTFWSHRCNRTPLSMDNYKQTPLYNGIFNRFQIKLINSSDAGHGMALWGQYHARWYPGS